MKIEWSEDALSDLDRFAEFLQKDYPALAPIVGEEIIAKTRLLAENPRLGRPEIPLPLRERAVRLAR